MKIKLNKVYSNFTKNGFELERVSPNVIHIKGQANDLPMDILLPEDFELEKDAVSQFLDFANYVSPSGKKMKCACATPDFHPGSTIPVGVVVVSPHDLVIPGAIGFFRKSAVQEIGGYKTDTLTEDFDLTLELQKNNWKVVLENQSVSYTEVPNTVVDLFKQRVRWTCGTFQTLLKNKNMFFNGTPVGNFGLPYALVFGSFLSIISPLLLVGLAVINFHGFLVWCVFEIILQMFAKRDIYALFSPIQRIVQTFFNFYVAWVSLFKFRSNHTWGKLKRTGV